MSCTPYDDSLELRRPQKVTLSPIRQNVMEVVAAKQRCPVWWGHHPFWGLSWRSQGSNCGWWLNRKQEHLLQHTSASAENPRAAQVICGLTHSPLTTAASGVSGLSAAAGGERVPNTEQGVGPDAPRRRAVWSRFKKRKDCHLVSRWKKVQSCRLQKARWSQTWSQDEKPLI